MWLIAGLVLITGTVLAATVQPLWILLIIATGVASITVALTGFCVVGNVLRLFGFTPMLGAGDLRPGKPYLMQTDAWYLERRIYLAVGINISIASAPTLVLSPWWLLFTGFVGVAMVWFAVTGFCIMANGLYWLGAEPRLKPEAGSRGPVVPEAAAPARLQAGLEPHRRSRSRRSRSPVVPLEAVRRPPVALQLLYLPLRRLQLLAVDPIVPDQSGPGTPGPKEPHDQRREGGTGHEQRAHRPAHQGHVSGRPPGLPHRAR